MGKYIPGNPNIIVENMDGAGSMLSMNQVYNTAKPDGLTMNVFNEAQILNQVVSSEGVNFDAKKMGWVGNAQRSTTACTIRADTPYQKAEDWLRKDLPPLNLGGTAPGSSTDD